MKPKLRWVECEFAGAGRLVCALPSYKQASGLFTVRLADRKPQISPPFPYYDLCLKITNLSRTLCLVAKHLTQQKAMTVMSFWS
jgi:hypothetical protein